MGGVKSQGHKLVQQHIDSYLSLFMSTTHFWNTVRCRYNAVNFLKNSHKRHPIARPLGRGMGWLLWIQHLVDILPPFLYLLMFDRNVRPRYNGTRLYSHFKFWPRKSKTRFVGGCRSYSEYDIVYRFVRCIAYRFVTCETDHPLLRYGLTYRESQNLMYWGEKQYQQKTDILEFVKISKWEYFLKFVDKLYQYAINPDDTAKSTERTDR